MRPSTARWRSLILVAAWLAAGDRSGAVLFHSTDDPAHNTSAPTGTLADSGWQFQGQWGNFLGTPIAANLFVTAKHIGGEIGGAFLFRGTTYHTVAFHDDPAGDLRVWRVCGTFPEWATLYTGTDELSRPAVVFGRGTRRGGEVRVSLGIGGDLKGWRWSTEDHVQRWGENTVSSIVNNAGLPDPANGSVLKFAFNANGGPNEAHLSPGDSGGAVFLNDGGVWKLAGINHAVDGPYNTAASGAGFHAAIFDEGGLYRGGENAWNLVPDTLVDIPGAFYATRISARREWLDGIIAAEAGVQPVPALHAAETVDGVFAMDTSAVVDTSLRRITTGMTSPTRFFRLRHCHALYVKSLAVEGVNAVLEYEDAP